MKTKYILTPLLFSFFCLSLKSQTKTISQNESISISTEYVDQVSMTWYVNGSDTNKPLTINYSIGTEYRYDFVNIYSIDANGAESLLVSLSGIQSGSISSVLPTGKIKITFTSDIGVNYNSNPSLFFGLQLSFSTDSSNYTSNLGSNYTQGNSIVNGNLGIGVLNPSYKLEVNGSAKFLENVQCATSISFQDNARFNVTKTIIPDLRTTSFLMPQYGVASPGAGGSADLWIAGNNGIRMFTFGNPNPALSITTNGSVGIGNTAPKNLLSVKGSATNVEIGQYAFSATNYGAIGFNSTAALSTANYALSGTSTNTTSVTNLNAGRAAVAASATVTAIPAIVGTLNLNIANTAKVVVTSGTTTVKNNLTVIGAVNAGSSGVKLSLGGQTGSVTTPLAFGFSNDYSNNTLAANSKLFLYNTGGTEIYGMGVGSMGDIQYHAGSTGNIYGKHDFYSGNDLKMSIGANGNVTISKGSLYVKNFVNQNNNSAIMVAHRITEADYGTSIRTVVENAGQNKYALQFFTQNTSGEKDTEKMRISGDGTVYVKGTIHAKEVSIDMDGPLADFVFKPTYKLMPLHEVEQYVNKNSHLPEIPSASEVEKNGMNMGEMQNKLLQKVEELTLYMIQLKKENDVMKAQITALSKK